MGRQEAESEILSQFRLLGRKGRGHSLAVLSEGAGAITVQQVLETPEPQQGAGGEAAYVMFVFRLTD